MSNKEDYNQYTRTQKKSIKRLKSYKEKLLDDLKLLAGETGVKNPLSNSSGTRLPNLNPPGISLSNLNPPETKLPNLIPLPTINNFQLENLVEENSMLKLEIESLKNRNIKLQTENNTLLRERENLKSEQANISILESEIIDLREMITMLAQEKEVIEKSILQTPPKVVSENHIELEEPVIVTEEVDPKEITPSQEELKKSRKKSKKPKKKKLSKEEIKAIQEKHETMAPVRRRCPTCLNLNKKFIREMQDKSNILMQNPTIYGKKFRCGICSTEWK
ncbi:hypothetical protein LCGC14_0696090 [marine sediment metagenome]|uniref:Uncharacterized protein n=1 Tax=marine sediment metagenome TaxID=412755 RepID=A0A0F9TRX5_9ZZZZ